MSRYIFRSLLFGLISTVVLTSILLLTHSIEYVWLVLKKVRGTDHYSGDESGLENLDITIGVVMPILFAFLFTIYFLYQIWRRKSK